MRIDIVELFVDQVIRDRSFQPHVASNSGGSLEELQRMVKKDLMARAQRRLNRALVEQYAPGSHIGAFAALLEQGTPHATGDGVVQGSRC